MKEALYGDKTQMHSEKREMKMKEYEFEATTL